MNIQQATELLLAKIAENKEHKDYKRCVQLAKDYRAIMTSQGQDDWVVSYKSRETNEQKKQRLDITISTTDYIMNRFVNLTDRIMRADNIVDNVYYQDDKRDISTINSVLDRFYQGGSLKAYLHSLMQYYCYYDPNAFLMINFRNEDGNIVPVPVEFPSDEVYQWYENENDILWFIARQSYISIEGEIGYKFTLLAPDMSVQAIEIKEGYTTIGQVYAIDVKGKGGAVKYDVIQNDNTASKITPVFKLGYVRDAATNRRTFVSHIHPAFNLIRKYINQVSEYDLSMAIHAFLQKYQYANVCEWEETDNEGEIIRCNEGYLRSSEGKSECPNCKGTGLVLHRTVQDIILIKNPDGKDEHIPLSEMVHYVQMPIDLINMQRDNIDRCVKDIEKAILNTELISRADVQTTTTATENIIDLENINSFLYRFGSAFAKIFISSVRQIAIYLGVDDGLIVNYEYPKDSQLETINMLLRLRAEAVNAGAPYTIIENIDTKILIKQSQGDIDTVEWVRAWERFRPFKELGVTERLNILSELSITDRKKVLYIYFEEIRQLVDAKIPNFYLIKDYVEQSRIIDIAIDDTIAKYNIKEDEPVRLFE